MKTFSQTNQNSSYLLDPNIQSEDTLEIYKSLWQIISENITWLTISLVLVISIILFVYFKNIRKTVKINETVEELIEPYAEALMAIEELQAQKNIIQPKPFVFRLSEILRIYIQKKFNMPAMELTGEEFIVEVVSNPFFSGNYEELLLEFVNLGDIVKYSKETTETSQISLLLDSALYFVKDTHSRLKAQENAQDKKEANFMDS